MTNNTEAVRTLENLANEAKTQAEFHEEYAQQHRAKEKNFRQLADHLRSLDGRRKQ